MTPERMKLPAILAVIAGSGLALLSWSQPWFEVRLQAGAGTGAPLAVGGDVASPALAALALAGLALAGALAIAGPGIRVLLGILAVVLGGCLVLAVSTSLGDVVGSVAPAVTDATGVTGTEPVAALLDDAAATAWPWVGLAGGIVVAAAGALVLATGHRWPGGSRRYGGGGRLAPTTDPADEPNAERALADELDSRADDPEAEASDATSPEGPPDSRPARDRAIDDWDELSRGDDPTA
ncbi:Trp biosynthesis-associated membrane protein [Agromyces intestinalis]|uniref:Trp biosynthesis-associated membrane protein n=1 Tax=Agromyces intestinalis TaxID=2592652 RepID=A0A5C1YKD3_9MICO|nr:Trp biosynthesis-associated membrane protein [Agromyces intestinalis]QEO15895.1 Trp biosynthesis-associated membrane protein [Agromyces intestinalis]